MKKGANFWGNANEQTFPSLTNDHDTDYLVIGGGIAGLAAAYFLSRRTKARITIIEKNTIGSGATGHSAGMLVTEPEHANWATYVTTFGPALSRTYAAAQRRALKTIQNLAALANHPIETNELLFLGTTAHTSKKLVQEAHLRAIVHLPTTTLTSKMRNEELGAHNVTQIVRAGNHISTNPLGFARAIAQYLTSRGVTIFEKTTCLEISRTRATTTNGTITFSHVIEASGVFTNKKNITAYLTTIAVTSPLSNEELAAIHLDDRDMFSDEEARSFHYGKLTSDNRLLVGYGDVVTETPAYPQKLHTPHVRNIERFLKRLFPTIRLTVAYAWSAPYALSKKLLPIVTVRERHTIINGGGTQLTSVVAAEYAVSTILKKKHPLEKLFEKGR